MSARLLRVLALALLLASASMMVGGASPVVGADATWTTSGPDGGAAGAVAVDPADASTAYASVARSGVWKTNDGGASWTEVLLQAAQSIAIDPTNSAIVYAAVGAQIWRSTDAGSTWSGTGSGLSYTGNPIDYVDQLAFPTASGELYALGDYGGSARLLKTSDGGGTWTFVTDIVSPGFRSFAIDPVSTASLYLAGSPADPNSTCCLEHSADSGGRFDMLPVGAGTRSLAIDRASHTLYAATVDGLRKSLDFGSTWNTTPLTGLIGTVAVSSGGTILASTGDALYRSADAGAHWQQAALGSFSATVEGIAFAPSWATTAYVTTDAGIFRSTDDGATWTAAAGGIRETIVNAVSATTGGVLFAGTGGQGVFRSDDQGATWSLRAAGLRGRSILSLANRTADGQITFAGTDDGLFKTDDGGASWFESDQGIATDSNGKRMVRQLLVNPKAPYVMFAAVDGVGVFTSTSGGDSWTKSDNALPSSFATALAIDPSAPLDLYWADSTGDAYRSTDGASTWTPLPTPANRQLNAIAVDPTSPSRIFLGYFSGSPAMYVSNDNGQTWTASLSPIYGVAAIAVDPASGTAFAATAAGVMRSVDGGSTWTHIGDVSVAGPGQTTSLALLHSTAGLHVVAGTFTPGGAWDFTYPAPQIVTSATAPAQDVQAGSTTTILLGSFTDSATAGPWTVTVDWGDGAAPTIQTHSATGDLGTATHTYAAAGTYTATVTVADALGVATTSTLLVNVILDVTPPVLQVPADFAVEAAGPNGAVVTYTFQASDPDDAVSAASCAPASGTTFPIGTTGVTCTASDTHGNGSSGSFNVVVHDTTPPTISSPQAITAEATGPSGAAVSLLDECVATDVVSAHPLVLYSPRSGSTFPLGVTAVTCTATDDAGNSSSAGFTVTVVDTTPPALTIPADISALATSSSGAPVTFSTTAADLVDGLVTPTCAPASAATFPIGTTTVTCSATDAHGNTSARSFTVTVSYNICPLYDPSKVAKLGSTVPIKVELCTALGADLSGSTIAMQAISLTEVSTTTSGAVADTGNADPDNDFRFDPTLGTGGGGYIYNLSTKGLTAGTWRLGFVVAGQTYSATLQVQ